MADRLESTWHRLPMPRIPDVPCSRGCGRMMWRGGKDGVPLDQRICRPCRALLAQDAQTVKACLICQSGYIPGARTKGKSPQECCSKSCAMRLRYQRKTGTDSAALRRERYRRKNRKRRGQSCITDDVPDVAIYQRDGWRCGICRRVIRRDLAWPHPRSASLDHLIPLSQAGDDTAANKRASHLACNIRRSNRGGNEQLALWGGGAAT